MSTQLLSLLGSGGVGKTSCAAALALAAVHDGRRVALLTIDPAQRLAQTLRSAPLTGTLTELSGSPGLWAMALNQQQTSDTLVHRFAPSSALAEEILVNPFYQAFSTRLAGVQEYMAIVAIEEILAEAQYDLLIVDTPPAQHALELIDAPLRLSRALSNPALSWLQHRRGRRRRGISLALKVLQRVTAGAFLEELADFLGLFSQILAGLEKDSQALLLRFHQTESRFLLISTPARGPLQAAVQTQEALKVRGFESAGLILNRSDVLPAQWSTERSLALHEALSHLIPSIDIRPLEHLWRQTSHHEAQRRAQIASFFQQLPLLIELPSCSDGLLTRESLRQFATPLWMKLREQ